MLDLKSVSFSYGRKRVLKDVSLSLRSGEILVVLGSNGAGKSTLLRVASGSLEPSSGEVQILGKTLSSYSVKELAKMRAFLEQESSLAFDSRVLDAVLLGRYAQGNFAATRNDVKCAESALCEVGLDGFEDRFFMSLSGGEKRRVMLARVLAQLAGRQAHSKSVLILDEPSSGLDPAHAHGALSAARRLADEGAAVLAVLHDPNLAVQYADKMAFLKSGALVGIHSAKEAMNASLLEEVYGAKCRIISDSLSDYALFLKD